MEPDASLFSFRLPHPLLARLRLALFFPSARESKLCATPLTSPSSHPSVLPPPRLVFQPVSLFNRLIPPSLIKHDHRPCEALRSSILLGSLSPRSGFYFSTKGSFVIALSSLYLSSFCFLHSLLCAPQVVSFNSSK